MKTNRLALISIACISTVISFSPAATQSVYWTFFALVYFSVAPGHALLLALFPAPDPDRVPSPLRLFSSPPPRDSLGRWIALSVALSLILAPLVGLVLVSTPLGLRTENIALLLNGLVVTFTLVPEFRPTFQTGTSDTDRDGTRILERPHVLIRDLLTGPRVDVYLNVVVALCVVLFAGSIVYAAVEPTEEHEYTQFFLPGQSESTGSSEYARYPSEVVHDERNNVSVGVTNQESQKVNYTVVVVLQTTTTGTNGTLEISGSKELSRVNMTVDSGETVTRDIELVLGEVGEDMRLTFLLYRGPVPPTRNITTADREVHLWVDATR